MGSKFKQTLFNEFLQDILKGWAKDSNSGVNASADRLAIDITNPVSLSQQPACDRWSRASRIELPPSRHPHI